MRLQTGPEPDRGGRAFENLAEQLVAALGHKGFDTHGDLRRRLFIELKIVFQIPTDAFAILGSKLKFDVEVEAERGAIRNFSRADRDSITVRSSARLLIDL